MFQVGLQFSQILFFKPQVFFFKLFFQLYTYSNMRNYSSIQFIYIYIHFFLEPFIAPFASYYCHEAHPSIEGHSIDSTFGLVGTKVGFDMGFHKLIRRIDYIWKVRSYISFNYYCFRYLLIILLLAASSDNKLAGRINQPGQIGHLDLGMG